jgi:hypothetical protein
MLAALDNLREHWAEADGYQFRAATTEEQRAFLAQLCESANLAGPEA